MKILKFGGSSLGNAERIKMSADIIVSNKDNSVIVLSAMQGVTNLLIEAAHIASTGDNKYRLVLDQLINLHKDTLKILIEDNDQFFDSVIMPLFDDLGEILHGIELLQDCTTRTKDLVMSFGERLSCRIMTCYLTKKNLPAAYHDSRELIKTDDTFNNGIVFFDESFELIRSRFSNGKEIAIVTGFIASTREGITTTLGRNGSDYTASILGAALDADSVEIWTDVDGVLSADPRIVKNAYVISELSMEEASEMAYFGAKVIHPYALHPLIEKNIPCWIKNTFNSSFAGSVIREHHVQQKPRIVTAIASIENVSFLNIVGSGMVGIPGVTSRIFNVFAKLGINIIMITQASSEHSVCILCKTEDAHKVKPLLDQELREAFQSRYLKSIEIRDNLEIVAVIGDKMKGTPGISGRLFSALGNAGINIQAIAQGSSERNISFVIEADDKNNAINVVHETFLTQKELA